MEGITQATSSLVKSLENTIQTLQKKGVLALARKVIATIPSHFGNLSLSQQDNIEKALSSNLKERAIGLNGLLLKPAVLEHLGSVLSQISTFRPKDLRSLINRADVLKNGG